MLTLRRSGITIVSRECVLALVLSGFPLLLVVRNHKCIRVFNEPCQYNLLDQFKTIHPVNLTQKFLLRFFTKLLLFIIVSCKTD